MRSSLIPHRLIFLSCHAKNTSEACAHKLVLRKDQVSHKLNCEFDFSGLGDLFSRSHVYVL